MRPRLVRIRAFALDVDGVLTDGRIAYRRGSDEKFFHVRDGVAFELLHAAGIAVVLVSGRRSPALTRRAAELPVDRVYQGVRDKLRALAGFLESRRLEWTQLCYMGDDLPDVPVMRRAGFSFAPADAAGEAAACSGRVCRQAGGRGAVREAVEYLLRAQGVWEKICADYIRSLCR